MPGEGTGGRVVAAIADAVDTAIQEKSVQK
jgi:hypothetical protein